MVISCLLLEQSPRLGRRLRHRQKEQEGSGAPPRHCPPRPSPCLTFRSALLLSSKDKGLLLKNRVINFPT